MLFCLTNDIINNIMKETISEKKTRIPYREPKVTAIELGTSGVLCQSGDIDGFTLLDDDSQNW